MHKCHKRRNICKQCRRISDAAKTRHPIKVYTVFINAGMSVENHNKIKKIFIENGLFHSARIEKSTGHYSSVLIRTPEVHGSVVFLWYRLISEYTGHTFPVIPGIKFIWNNILSQVMRFWHLLSSVISFFKRTFADIQWGLMSDFFYFYTLCMRKAKALARLRGFAVSPEPSMFAYAISTIIS